MLHKLSINFYHYCMLQMWARCV